MQWVKMTHPDLPGQSAVVSAAAYEKVWQRKGWTVEVVGLDADVETVEPETDEEPETTSSRRSRRKETD